MYFKSFERPTMAGPTPETFNKGGFPMEIKTKIRYLIIVVIIFLPYKIMITQIMISYFDRKSTLRHPLRTVF